MIKKILLAVALAFPMFVSAQTLKFGIVDTNAVLTAMPETQAAQAKIADTSKKYEDEYALLQEQMKKLYDELSAMPESEPQAIKDRKTREFSDMQQKIQNFLQNADQDLQKVQQELMAPIFAKVRNAVESVGKEGNYSYIQENAPTILYYAAPVEDCTEAVKAKLGLK